MEALRTILAGSLAITYEVSKGTYSNIFLLHLLAQKKQQQDNSLRYKSSQ